MSGTGAVFRATLNSGGGDESQSGKRVTTRSEHFIDYDTDDDGLIEISTLAQLDAVRHDLDGDGTPSAEGETTYSAAFPDAAHGMGCGISNGCSGYELMADLDFDTNGSGRADTGDDFWNDGQGWVPIGGADSIGTPRTGGAVTRRNPFHATFEGNGHTIANLFVQTRDALFMGLFGYAGYDSTADSYSIIRRVGMIGVELSGYNHIGGLVGWNEGSILSSYATGQVSGWYSLGGLVGLNRGSILSSYANVRLSGHQGSGRAIGGLVGSNETISGASSGGLPESRRGIIAGSYATGPVSGVNFSGGLVGNNDGTIIACYATGRVRSGSSGGLVGYNDDTITSSYSTGEAFSFSSGGDALVHLNFGFIDDSYFDSRTTLWLSLFSFSSRAVRTEDLQTPTGYTGLYENWNVDLDGDNSPDDPWHFGTTSQYPVLKADLDGNGRATWQEFGYQIREGPTLSATAAVRNGETEVDLTWNRVNTGHWSPAPTVTYILRRDDYPFVLLRKIAEGSDLLRYTDTVSPIYRHPDSNRYAYQVAAVVSGGEATHSVPNYLELPDTKRPEVSRIGFNLTGNETTHPAEFVIEVFVDFGERVLVTGQPRLTLELGGEERTAIFTSGGGYSHPIFSYTVAPGDIDTNGMSIPAGRIDLNGGTIEDEAGNAALLDYPGVGPKLTHKVDGNKPVLLSPSVDRALLTLTYDEALDSRFSWPHTDDFTVEVGGTDRSIGSLELNGGVVELTLATAVGSGDTGIRVSYTPGSNPIRDLAGNHADALNDRPVTNTTGASNTAPEFTGAAVLNTPENRTERWRLTAVDSDDGDEVTGWEISGGANRNRFLIDEVTGDFGFSQAPNYETPADQASPAGNNEYVAIVRMTSGAGSRALTAEQEIRVTVEDEEEPPARPEVSSVLEPTLDSLRVEWTEPDSRGPAVTGYLVRYRKTGDAEFAGVRAGIVLEWTLTGLEEDTAYEVQVRAANDEGASLWSEPVRGRTKAPLTVEITTLEEPPVEGPFTLRIAFSGPVTGFESSDIEIRVETDCRDSGNNPLDCIPNRGALRNLHFAGGVSGPSFGLTLTPRTEGVVENYTLGIRIAAGSALSSGDDKSNREGMLEVRVSPPGVLVAEPISSIGLRASAGSRSVRLSWNQPSDDGGSAIVRYEYRYAVVGEEFGVWRSVGAEVRGVTVGNLINGMEYIFEVRAVNELGKGGEETIRVRVTDEEEEGETGKDPSDFTGEDLEGRRLTLKETPEEGTLRSLRIRFDADNRFEQTVLEGGEETEVEREGRYAYQHTGAGMGTLTLNYDGGISCEIRLSFAETGVGTYSRECSDGSQGEGSFRLTTGSLLVPVILSAAGRNNSFFTSELTLTNRGEKEVTLDYLYKAEAGGGSGRTTDRLAAGRQIVKTDALTYLRNLGAPIPDSGNRVGTLRVEVKLGSEVGAVVRTTTVVPEGRAGLAYLGVAEEEGFSEPVYLCGLRQNAQDRSNLAFQNMGVPGEGVITIRTTVYSGEAADATARVLEDVTLKPGGFHQFNQVLNVLGSNAAGYVRVERVEGEAPFYAYGVINDQVNSDGSFIFPLTASSLERKRAQTLPVIVETSEFSSELTVTNFSEEPRTLNFEFVSEQIQEGRTAAFSMRLEAGEQQIVSEVVEAMRRQGVAGLGMRRGFYAGPLFVEAEEGDLSGVVTGARTGSKGGGGQYSVFYNAVPEGEGFTREAWVEGLQQNEENRSNLALVNTGEVDDSESVFHLEIYDGDTGMLVETVATRPVPARSWHQLNGILGKYAPETRQGYIRIERVSGENPFLAYGVINDGGAPGERSGDGAYVPAGE